MEESARKTSGLQYLFYRFKLWIKFINNQRSSQVVCFILGEFWVCGFWVISPLHVSCQICMHRVTHRIIALLLLMPETSVVISLFSFLMYAFSVLVCVWFVPSIFVLWQFRNYQITSFWFHYFCFLIFNFMNFCSLLFFSFCLFCVYFAPVVDLTPLY